MPCMCGSEIRNLSWLRLAIWMILQCEECNFCAVFATCCSSWVHINTGTSKRSVLLPEGATHLDYIYNSNKMVARSLGSSRSITIYVLYFAYTCLQRVHARSNICQVEHGWFSTYDFFLFPIPCMHMICIVPWFLYVDLRCILLFMLIVARGGTFSSSNLARRSWSSIIDLSSLPHGSVHLGQDVPNWVQWVHGLYSNMRNKCMHAWYPTLNFT